MLVKCMKIDSCFFLQNKSQKSNENVLLCIDCGQALKALRLLITVN